MKFLLCEASVGFVLFRVNETDAMALSKPEVQKSLTQFQNFSKILSFHSLLPFETPEEALTNINMISESVLPETLKNWLHNLLVADVDEEEKQKIEIASLDVKLGSAIEEALGISSSKRDQQELILELTRGAKLHLVQFLKEQASECFYFIFQKIPFFHTSILMLTLLFFFILQLI